MVLGRRLRILLRSRLASSIAVVLGIAAAGVGTATLIDDGDGLRADDADVRFVEDFALAVTTFDSGRVDADIERILDFGTRDFATDFQASMGDTFVEDLRASGASSIGEIVAGPTIQRAEGSSAVYFVVVNQRIIAPSSAEGSDGEVPESAGGGSGDPAAPAPPTDESRTVRVGLLVQLDLDTDLVSSVEVL